MLKILSKIRNIGITPEMNFRQQRSVRIINIISIITAILYVGLFFIHQKSGETLNSWVVLGIGIITASSIFWNFVGFNQVSKFIICFGASCIPLFNQLIGGKTPDGQYINLPIIGISFIIVSTILISRRDEKILFYFAITYYLVWLLFADQIFYALSNPKPQIGFILENYSFYKMPVVLSAIMLVVLIISFKNTIYFYEFENEQIKQELRKSNERLKVHNSDLELRIQERTSKLAEITTRLLNLANITSHKIRGPLASILGITQLIKSNIYDREIENALPKLHDKCLEMDKVIHQMSDVLKETEEFKEEIN